MAANAIEDEADSASEMETRDPMSIIETHAIDIMAQTRAFYHSKYTNLRRISTEGWTTVAVRRYAEETSQIICHDLLLDLNGRSSLMQKGSPNLMQQLRNEIGVSGPDAVKRCTEFLEPSQENRTRRESLEVKKTLIKRVLKELEDAKKLSP
jgi:hypothetical protein